MTAQELINTAEVHRFNGHVWKARPLWEQVVTEFPGSAESTYAEAQLGKHADEKRSVIVEGWRGQRPLGEMFWVYYVFLQAGLFVVALLISLLEPTKLKTLLSLTFRLTVLGLAVPYMIWIYFSLWRCANNAPTALRLLARGFVIVVSWIPLIVLAVGIVLEFLGR